MSIISYDLTMISFYSPSVFLISKYSISHNLSYHNSPLVFLSQTFAKLQSFTSAIRKSKKSTVGDGDDDDKVSEKFRPEHKTSKERAIEKLQGIENEDDDNDHGDCDLDRRGGKEEYEAYNGQVLEGASDDEEVGTDWHKGKLKFRRHITDKLKVGGDGRRLDDYVLIDPRSRQ